MHKLILLVSLIVSSVNCAAQTVENVFGDPVDTAFSDEVMQQSFIQPDTILLKNANIISRDSLSVWKKKKEFAYISEMDSLLRKTSSRSDRKVDATLSLAERFLNSAFFRFFIWLIPVSLLLLVLYNFLKSQGTFIRKKKTNVHEQSEEDVQNTTYDYLALAQESASAGDYRPAVKYLFLRTLQQLAAGGMINFASDKTNYNYVQEISPDKRKEFAKLVLNYEYVWYGNSIPGKAMYTEIENQFITFLKKYNLS